jgi:hypothetical protein
MAKPQLSDRLARGRLLTGHSGWVDLRVLRNHTNFNGVTLKVPEGVQHGVSKGVENSCRLPTLRVATPVGSHF